VRDASRTGSKPALGRINKMTSGSCMEYPPGWTCEVVVVRIERYVMRTLPRQEALAVAEHIEACAACAQLVALLRMKIGAGPSIARSRRPG
jgi:hypothetical protein